MPHGEESTLRDALGAGGRLSSGVLWSADASVALGDLIRGTSLASSLDVFHGRSVLVRTDDQLTAMLAFIELDGIAHKLILCPPDLPLTHIASVMEAGCVDIVVSDRPTSDADTPRPGCQVACSPKIVPADPGQGGFCRTEWVLLTSGTTGLPKMISHTLASLAGAIGRDGAQTNTTVWSTFYDIRRYGGLQILLRALLGGGSLVLSSAREPIARFPHARRRAWRDAHLRDAVALAPRAHESGGSQYSAPVCPPVGRRSRIRRSWITFGRSSRAPGSPTRSRRPRPASRSTSATAWRAFRPA